MDSSSNSLISFCNFTHSYHPAATAPAHTCRGRDGVLFAKAFPWKKLLAPLKLCLNFLKKYVDTLFSVSYTRMGVARRGNTFSKDFSKNSQNIEKILKKFSKNFGKFLKIFLGKLLKMHYFSIVFSQFNKARGHFGAFGRKRSWQKIFEKFFENY